MMSVYDLNVTDALLTTTRSVRKRLDLTKPVSRDVIMRCIELSTQAPTGSNQQNWRWMVVTDAQKRRALADLYYKGAIEYLGSSAADGASSDDAPTSRVFDSARYLLDVLKDVPVHVIPCIEVEAMPTTNSVSYWASVMGSIMPAVWSFNLALRARGLGTVLTTLHLGYTKEVSDLLGIPDNVMQVGLLPVAYTIGTEFKLAKRLPLDSIVHFDSW